MQKTPKDTESKFEFLSSGSFCTTLATQVNQAFIYKGAKMSENDKQRVLVLPLNIDDTDMYSFFSLLEK